MPDWSGFSFSRNMISSFDTYDSKILCSFSGAGGSAWPASNRALFSPLFVPSPVVVKRLIVMNGSPSGNMDVGIYRDDLSRLVSSGSVANSGSASTPQVVDITDTLLTVGRYYIALVLDNTTATIYREASDIQQLRVLGMFQMDTAFPLPDPAVPAALATTYLPLVAAEVLRYP